MSSLEYLSDADRQAYEKILQPTASEPLEWREVRSLFRAIAKMSWQTNGDLKVERNGHVLVLRPPDTRYVSGADEILELRRFIERSEAVPPVMEPPMLDALVPQGQA